MIINLYTKIHFSGERLISKNPISNIIEPQYYEKVLIQTSDGEIEAATLYNDSRTGFETVIDFIDFL